MKKNKVIVWLFLGVLFGFACINLMKTDETYSYSERRRLHQFPEVNAKNILSGKFMEDFEAYSQDQFVNRELFRTVKAVTEVYGFQKMDNNDIYVANGYASALEYPLNEESIDRAAKKFSDVYEQYIEDSSCQSYFAIIPDKNYYLAKEHGYPAMDYESFFEMMQEGLEQFEFVEVAHLLDIEDYYRTDTHWKQEMLLDVAGHLAKEMGSENNQKSDSAFPPYEEVVATDDFYGVYAGQSALPLKADELLYLDNDVLEQCRVYDYQNDCETTIYNLELAKGKDPYEMYLSGPISLITIENPAGQTGKELILFRDSFGSSIAPLFLEYYDKITLVDIRYLPANRLGQYIEFEDQDVLFLYSTLVLNHSETLK